MENELVKLTVTIIDKEGRIIVHQKYILPNENTAKKIIKRMVLHDTIITNENAVYSSKTVGSSIYVKWIKSSNKSRNVKQLCQQVKVLSTHHTVHTR